MPFDSKGKFTRLHSWEQDRIDDIDIVTDHHDDEDNNFADAFNQCFLRSGVVPMQGDVDVAGFKVVGLADGYADKDAVNLKQLKEKEVSIRDFFNLITPVGDIKPSLLNVNHDNWLLCNGQAISREDYPDLFKLMGVNFGKGNGVTTFNVPDYRGKFLRGLGGGSAANMHTAQSDALQGHMHAATNISVCDTNAGRGNAFITTGSSNYVANFNLPVLAKGLISDAANGTPRVAKETRPINYAVNYFVKAKKEA